ncbi:catechol 2,3-dioxygenase-like lactoylglutathione lyase family enzyme [Pseudomonas duriflava]|uniref:Catechol 2,3-dioxygenase-like lactoylglutathione lyase family enzyme n=1 Tax=Pseudomonas duriflava TaxID=459528 RepID=A0A562PU87_9PSED|nr:VOC family protein [Pseudomonas duriflava]TWI47984.1 catechol 2,3-dioxygenase-like lactoylglutathione lyase family enzyme [Pseudomonas duriflava]
MSILDHIEFSVKDAEVSRQFYERALAPLGVRRIITVPPANTCNGGTRHGFGKGYPCLWVHDRDIPGKGNHIAFTVQERALVDAFYHEAVAAGGEGNGVPGVRSHYHDNYYAAYVLDPDGVNIEVVCLVACEANT